MTAEVRTLAALAPFVEGIADFAADGWDREGGRIDWESFLVRLERYLDLELPEDMRDPVIRKVQRIARQAAAEAGLE